jgi:hypothetical protein
MNDNKNKPVQVVLTYNAANSSKTNFHPKALATNKVEKSNHLTKIDESHKLVRRYTFDDNGGGYLGL